MLNPTLTRAQANLSLEAPRAAIRTPNSASSLESPNDVALGLAYRQKGYHDEALRSYERAAAMPGGEAAALEGMLELHLIRRDAAAAAEAGAKLVAAFPLTPKILNDYGAALQMLGRHDEAEGATTRPSRSTISIRSRTTIWAWCSGTKAIRADR